VSYVTELTEAALAVLNGDLQQIRRQDEPPTATALEQVLAAHRWGADGVITLAAQAQGGVIPPADFEAQLQAHVNKARDQMGVSGLTQGELRAAHQARMSPAEYVQAKRRMEAAAAAPWEITHD
jgi:hypothetical protein